MTNHTCDPTGQESCPLGSHPYASTAEVLERQNALAAKRAAEKAQRAPRAMLPAKGPSVASRVADGLITQLESVVKRGYQPSNSQAERLARLKWAAWITLPDSAWEPGSPWDDLITEEC